MRSQDAVDALVPNPRGLLEAIQGAAKPTHISWLFEAFGQIHVNGGVNIAMQECSDSVELVEFPSAQNCAGDNAAD
jgi:hypothetical protein